jgi:hypothetical protein
VSELALAPPIDVRRGLKVVSYVLAGALVLGGSDEMLSSCDSNSSSSGGGGSKSTGKNTGGTYKGGRFGGDKSRQPRRSWELPPAAFIDAPCNETPASTDASQMTLPDWNNLEAVARLGDITIFQEPQPQDC